MSKILSMTASRAASWSETASRLKTQLDAVRLITFLLSIMGALLAAMASQTDGELRKALSATGTLSLAAGAFAARRFLGKEQTQAWTRARAGSEALSREAFKFAAKAAPYDDPATAERLLDDRRAATERNIEDLVKFQVETGGDQVAPSTFITPETYLKTRIRFQIENFYRQKAEKYKKNLSRLKSIEFMFSSGAMLCAALAGFYNRIGGVDSAVFAAVFTTVSGIIISRIESCRYEYLVTSYRAAARRLEDQAARFGEAAADQAKWSRFVNDCEKIIEEENASWIAKWTKRNGSDRA
jgi:hypothetical protein